MDDGKSAPAKVRTFPPKTQSKWRRKAFSIPQWRVASRSVEPKEESKDTPNTLKKKRPTFQPSKRQKRDQYEEQLSGSQDNIFAKSASVGGVASYTDSSLHPAQYLQLGVMAFLVNMNFYLQAMYFTGDQRPKRRSHPGLTLLWDCFAFPFLILKTYLIHSLNVMDPDALMFTAFAFSGKEELNSRINGYSCSSAASVLRMYTGCGLFVKDSDSNERVVPFAAQFKDEGAIPDDPQPGLPWVGDGSENGTARLVLSRMQRLQFMTSLHPREISVMIVGLIQRYGFDTFNSRRQHVEDFSKNYVSYHTYTRFGRAVRMVQK